MKKILSSEVSISKKHLYLSLNIITEVICSIPAWQKYPISGKLIFYSHVYNFYSSLRIIKSVFQTHFLNDLNPSFDLNMYSFQFLFEAVVLCKCVTYTERICS